VIDREDMNETGSFSGYHDDGVEPSVAVTGNTVQPYQNA
jgi:hypothetical protein